MCDLENLYDNDFFDIKKLNFNIYPFNVIKDSSAIKTDKRWFATYQLDVLEKSF